jgi:hypothetical protein
MAALPKHFRGLPKGLQISSFAIDAKTAMVLKNQLAKHPALEKDLPSRHTVKWGTDFVGHMINDVRVSMARVIRRNQDPLVTSYHPLQSVEVTNLDFHQLLFVILAPFPQRSPHSDPEWAKFRGPPSRRNLLRVTVHRFFSTVFACLSSSWRSIGSRFAEKVFLMAMSRGWVAFDDRFEDQRSKAYQTKASVLVISRPQMPAVNH